MDDKLKNILFNLTNSNPNYSFTPSQLSAIQHNLLRTVSSLKTPTHPTYDSMISSAIKELIEEGYSTTEEMISARIVEINEGLLPWAHKRFLKHHLDKMCENGDLDYESDDGCYYKSSDDMRPKQSGKRLRLPIVSGAKDDVVEEELNDDVVSDELGRENRKRKRTRCIVFDEEEDEDENENEAVVTAGNAEACSEVLRVENREDERKSGEFVVGEYEPKQVVVHCEERETAVKTLHVVAPLLNPEMINAGETVAVEKSVLKGTKLNSCGNELTIVPHVRNLEDSAVGKIFVPLSKSNDTVVICCLPCREPETPKKKGQQNRKGRRSKSAPEKAKALDSSEKRSRETKLKRKSQSAKLKGVTLLEDGPAKLPEKPETTTNPGLLVSFSMDDDTKPIRQLFRKCGNRKRHSMQVAVLKDASALSPSKASNQSPEELPSLETSVEMAPTVEKELALTKGAEEHIHVQLSLRDKSCDNVEEGAVGKSTSSFLEEKGTSSSEGPDKRQPTYSNSTVSCEPDVINVKHQEKQPQLSSDSQCALDGGVSESIVGGPKVQCLEEPSKPMETTDGFATPSSLVELDQQEVRPSELPGSQIVVEGPKIQCLEEHPKLMETADGFTIRSSLVELHRQEVGPSESTGSQVVVEGPKVQCLQEPLKSKQTTDGLITPPLLVELHKQEVGPSELAGSQNIVEGSEVQCLEESSKPVETADGFTNPSSLVELHQQEVGPSESTGSQIVVEGLKVQCLEEPLKSKETTDGLITPSMHVELHQQDVGPSELSGFQSIVGGPRVQCLEPSKSKETTDEFSSFTTPLLPVDLHQQEVGPSEPMGCQTIVEGPKVQCLEEPSKSKETTDGLITPSMPVELHQQVVGASESTGSLGIVEGPKVQCLEESSKPKDSTDGFITPSMPVELHQQEVGASELTNSQGIVEGPKVQCLEEPPKSKETTVGLITPTMPVELHRQEVGASESTGSLGIVEGPKAQCLEEASKPKENTDAFITPSLVVELRQQEVGPPEPAGHGSSDNHRSQVLINQSIGAASSSQCSEHLVEGNAEQSQHEVRHEVLELSVEKNADEKFHESDQYPRQPQKDDQEKENKDDREKLNQDGQERPLKLTEATLEDETYLSGSHNHILEGLSKLTSQEHSGQLNEQLENSPLQKRKPGRPRKSNASTMLDASNSSDLSSLHLHKQEAATLASIQSSQQKNKWLKQDGQVRTRQQLANMKDAENLLDPHPREQERLSETEKEPPICSEERLTKKDNNEEVEYHAAAINTPQSQHHNNKRKRGRPPVQKNMNRDDLGSQNRLQKNSGQTHSLGEEVTKGGAAPSNLQCPEQGSAESASHMVLEASSTQSHVDLKECMPAASDHISCPDSAPSAVGTSSASTCLADQSSQQDKNRNQPRRPITRHYEAAKSIFDSQNEVHSSNQRRLAKPTPDLSSDQHFVAKEFSDSENEIHGKPIEIEQTEVPLDDKISQQGHLPPSKPVTRLSNSEHHQGRVSESHDHDQAHENMENRFKCPKEKKAKSAPILVPLSSKDHLRSRMKRQCEDST